ncbi:MAG: hypothetical protein ABI592_11580 [Acidobacteriota bacterium]
MKAKTRTKTTTKTRSKSKAAASSRPKAPTRRATARKPAPAAGRAHSAERFPAGSSSPRRRRGTADWRVEDPVDARGMGAESGGQSGDTEGLSRSEQADSESVEELVEEGQAFEAGVVSGVENAPDADQGPVRTREVPVDDVPEEYLEDDRPNRG